MEALHHLKHRTLDEAGRPDTTTAVSRIAERLEMETRGYLNYL
jgi:hypothetical protein